MIVGYLINKFRGDVSLFDDGLRAIERFTGWRCFGVVPWLKAAARLPSEDSVVLERLASGEKRALKVAVPMILADGSVSESEMVAFRRICKEAFGIPETSIDSVIEYLNDFGYETNGSQAIALFRDLDVERRKLLAQHMAEIAKADSKLAENEVKLLRRTLDLLDISPVDVVKPQD